MYNDPAAGESPRGPIRPDDGAAPGPDTAARATLHADRVSDPRVCPFLRVIDDGERLGPPIEAPDPANRCAALREPVPQSLRQQELVCLSSGHVNCPRYLRGGLDVAADQAGPHAPGRSHRQRHPGDGRRPGDLHGRLPAVARLRAGQRRRGPDRRRADAGAVRRGPRRDRDGATDPRPDATSNRRRSRRRRPRRRRRSSRPTRPNRRRPRCRAPRPSRPRRRRPSHRRPSRPPAAMRC